MKKILTVLLFTSLCLSVNAAAKEIQLTFKNKRPTSEGTYERFPMGSLPIDVDYDEEARTVTVTSSDPELDANVILYNANDVILDYSNTLNTVLYVHPSQTPPYIIYLESDTWEASAMFY